MGLYTQQLKTLQEQTARKKHLESAIEDLLKQQRSLSDKAVQLKSVMLDEQKDVDRLHQGSLASFFYELIGKKDEKLAKEQREAYAARLKYDAAARELEAVESALRRNQAELEALQGCDQQYEQLLAQVLMEIKTSGDPLGTAVVEQEKRISDLLSKRQEIREAIAAAQKALGTVEQVQSHLRDAEDWGGWDLFGGGLLSDIAKHDALDSAQADVEILQIQLRELKTELVDVSVDVDVKISIEGFLGFADFFFDGLFADWAVMDKIEQTSAQVSGTKGQLQEVMNKLRDMEEQTRQEIWQCNETLGQLAVQK